MVKLKNRSEEEELMDDLSAGGEEMDQTLKELETINTWLGGNYVTINGIGKLLKMGTPKRPLVIADLGCGGGDMLKLVKKWADKNGIEVNLKGYDANPYIIEYAKANCSSAPEIAFYSEDIFSESFRTNSFDIVLCTLFTHHFTDDQLKAIFDQFKEQTTLGVVINDLHRHWFAYYSIKWLTRWFSKSPMVKVDAPLSVKRSFRRRDIETIMSHTSIETYTLEWMWAFRWQLIF